MTSTQARRRRPREFGPDNPDIIYFMDSQGRKVLDHPDDFSLPPNCRLVVVSGGGLEDVLEYASRPIFRAAKTIVLAGIGTNNIAKRGTPRPAPPLVTAATASNQLTFDDKPSTDNQVQRADKPEMIALYQRVKDAIGPNQTLVTTDPIARKSIGFINNTIRYISKRMPRSPHHHHLQCLSAFATRNRWKKHGKFDAKDPKTVYGGNEPTRDLCFEKDGVHLNLESLQNFMRAVARMIDIVRIVESGQPAPEKGSKLMDVPGFTWGF